MTGFRTLTHVPFHALARTHVHTHVATSSWLCWQWWLPFSHSHPCHSGERRDKHRRWSPRAGGVLSELLHLSTPGCLWATPHQLPHPHPGPRWTPKLSPSARGPVLLSLAHEHRAEATDVLPHSRVCKASCNHFPRETAGSQHWMPVWDGGPRTASQGTSFTSPRPAGWSGSTGQDMSHLSTG